MELVADDDATDGVDVEFEDMGVTVDDAERAEVVVDVQAARLRHSAAMAARGRTGSRTVPPHHTRCGRFQRSNSDVTCRCQLARSG